METPVQIDFQGMDASEPLRASISQHVDALEQRFGRITSCRVVLKAPGGHHQTGGLYDVNIRLALPEGREVNVGRTATKDERFSDVTYAINHAFKRARRQLQDRVRVMRGKVKAHEGEPIGTVIRLDSAGGFGFLQTVDEREIYFHRNSLLTGDFELLNVGDRVTFFEEMGEKGAQASTVKILGKHGLR